MVKKLDHARQMKNNCLYDELNSCVEDAALPSFSALRVFESAVRLGSFAAAAEEFASDAHRHQPSGPQSGKVSRRSPVPSDRAGRDSNGCRAAVFRIVACVVQGHCRRNGRDHRQRQERHPCRPFRAELRHPVADAPPMAVRFREPGNRRAGQCVAGVGKPARRGIRYQYPVRQAPRSRPRGRSRWPRRPSCRCVRPVSRRGSIRSGRSRI